MKDKKITAFKLLKQLDPGAAKYIKWSGYKQKLNSDRNLGYLFIWRDSPQGEKYWYCLYSKLKAAIKEHGI